MWLITFSHLFNCKICNFTIITIQVCLLFCKRSLLIFFLIKKSNERKTEWTSWFQFCPFQCRSTYMIFICFKPFVGYYWYIYMYTHNFQVSIKLNCMSGIQYIILNKYPRNNILTLRAVINTLCFLLFCFISKPFYFIYTSSVTRP